MLEVESTQTKTTIDPQHAAGADTDGDGEDDRTTEERRKRLRGRRISRVAVSDI